MDERDDEATSQPGGEPTPDPGTAWATALPADPGQTGVVPAVYVGPAVADEQAPPVPPASPMPLSMPPYDPSPLAGGSSLGAPPPPEQPWSSGGYGDYLPPPPGSPAASGPRHGRRLATAVAAAALVAGGLGAGLGVAFSSGSPGSSGLPAGTKVPVVPPPSRSAQASTGPSESTAAIAKSVEPAIVDINTNVASPASQGQEQAAGTGMIITSSGEVLTNNHVVENATKISVSITGRSGTYTADVIGVDPTKDVALLQIEGVSGGLPTVALGDSSTVAVGNPVVAIGNALGLGQQPTTVTGIVSALGRTITASDGSAIDQSETLSDLIETDAPIQPGDSGGPLLNSKGQVIGMDTAALSSSDSGATLGFSIPVNAARQVAQQIERGQATGGIVLGESPFLGVFEETGSVSNGFGSLGNSGAAPTVAGVALSDVAIGGPAQDAGIVAGDTITAIGSTATTTPTALAKAIDAYKPGDQVSVTYVDTSGDSHTVNVTLAGIPK